VLEVHVIKVDSTYGGKLKEALKQELIDNGYWHKGGYVRTPDGLPMREAFKTHLGVKIDLVRDNDGRMMYVFEFKSDEYLTWMLLRTEN